MKLTRTISIYALLDPRSQQVRYVGQSVHPETRFCQHIDSRNYSGNARMARWLDDLKRRGVQPALRILEECRSYEQADLQERYWIKRFLSEDIDLLNVCDGKGRGITKAVHHTKTEWLTVADRLREVRGELSKIHLEISRRCGTSKPVTRQLFRALCAVDQSRSDLEDTLHKHFPEWGREATEALYE